MIRIRDLSLPPDGDMARLVQAAARQLRISPNEIKQLDLKKKSVDARKKNDVRIIYTVDVVVKGREDKILKMAHCPKASAARDVPYRVPQPQTLPDSRPIIVGFGPAGMFAALVLSMAGLCPLVLERGQDAKTRHEAVLRFWQTGELDPECNVQFGEGGAGTFSDGKLNTGVKNERIGWILEQFAEAGASADILYDAKPHIGTDELVTVVQNLREKILHYGGEVRFGTRLTGLESENGRVTAVRVQSADSETVLPASRVLLAIGHSARDTFETLHSAGIPMEPKPFSMGVRIEHPQRLVNESQYGPFADAPGLGAADYKLNVRLPDGSSAYTFCMCPGGYVVAAASEEGGVLSSGRFSVFLPFSSPFVFSPLLTFSLFSMFSPFSSSFLSSITELSFLSGSSVLLQPVIIKPAVHTTTKDLSIVFLIFTVFVLFVCNRFINRVQLLFM